MKNTTGISIAALLAGAVALSGCATTQSVERAQATADQAMSRAQAAETAAARAQASADAAGTAAQSAGTAAQGAQTAADAAAAEARNANQQIEQMKPAIAHLEHHHRHHTWRDVSGKKPAAHHPKKHTTHHARAKAPAPTEATRAEAAPK